MIIENEIVINQAFDVSVTEDQLIIVRAKEIIELMRPFVKNACNHRDYDALALIPKVDNILSKM